MTEPNYLVQTEDKTVHAYWTLEILLIDIALRRDEPVTLFKRVSGRFTPLSYHPTTEADLRTVLQAEEGKAS